jgi:hypothetical protein
MQSCVQRWPDPGQRSRAPSRMGHGNGEPMRGIKEDTLEATSQGDVLTDRQGRLLGCAVVWARANIKTNESERERSERERSMRVWRACLHHAHTEQSSC